MVRISELSRANRRHLWCVSASECYREDIMTARNVIERHIAPRLDEALADTPVVILQGARQVGKSTLAAAVASRLAGRLVTLDDEPVRRAALTDPASFVESADGLMVIDEVQRAPELLLAIKAAVDRDRRPGRFLLTGSANLLQLRSVQDSLAGRAETIELFGFSQGELHGVREAFVDRLLSEVLPAGWESSMARSDYVEVACAGGYPEALVRMERRRAAWFESYTQRIIERDAADVSGLQRLGDLGRVLRLVAARNATELNQADLAADSGFPARTLPPYLDLLETLYLIWRVPAWSTNLTRRVVDRPKVIVVDSGLAAHLINVSPTSLHPTRQPLPAGGLIEAFALAELRRQTGWNDERVRIFHYRDRTGPEIDIVLEHADGRIAAVEVKATSSIGASAFTSMKRLRDNTGQRFVQGVVLYTGASALSFGDRLTAQPLAALWDPHAAA